LSFLSIIEICPAEDRNIGCRVLREKGARKVFKLERGIPLFLFPRKIPFAFFRSPGKFIICKQIYQDGFHLDSRRIDICLT